MVDRTFVPRRADGRGGSIGNFAAGGQQRSELKARMRKRDIATGVAAVAAILLSVAAAYGVLVIVFQHGFAKDLLGFSSTAGIGSTKRLAPEPEEPWMIPGTWPRCSAFSSRT